MIEPCATVFWIGVAFLSIGLATFAISRERFAALGFFGVLTGTILMATSVTILIAAAVFS